MEDYYQTLGIRRNATLDDIKRAYRRAVIKHHPDQYEAERVAADDDEALRRIVEEKIARANAQMQKLNRAYEILSDPYLRRRYDFDLERPKQARDTSTNRPPPRQPPPRARRQPPPANATHSTPQRKELGGWVKWLRFFILLTIFLRLCGQASMSNADINNAGEVFGFALLIMIGLFLFLVILARNER